MPDKMSMQLKYNEKGEIMRMYREEVMDHLFGIGGERELRMSVATSYRLRTMTLAKYISTSLDWSIISGGKSTSWAKI